MSTFRGGVVLLAIALALWLEAAGAAAQALSSEAASIAGQPASARDVERGLEEAVRHTPDSFDAHHNLGEFYIQQQQLALAIPHLEKARAIDPSHYVNGYDLALAYLQLDRVPEARQQIEAMLRLKETAELHNLLGSIEEGAGKLTDAAKAYQRAAQRDPSEKHLFDFGNSLLQLQAYDDAIKVFDTATERYPRSARLYVGLGIGQYSRGKYDDAVKSLCAAADLAPSDPRPYQFLGEMYGVAPELGEEVTERLARFVEVQPTNALAHYYYAMSLWKGERGPTASVDLQQIEKHLKRAVSLDAKLSKAFLQLGTLYGDQGRHAEAIEALRQAVQLEPDHAQAHYRLARAYQNTGQRALAAKELELFQQLKTKK